MGDEVYELIIVGAGPAGITASIYAARKQMDFIVVSEDVGGQAAISGAIENYLGYQFITGPELARKFQEHMETFDIELVHPESVARVERVGEFVEVETDRDIYRAASVIVASGRRPRKLNVAGEDELKNRGVTYCATCDAPLFAGMDVAVVGGGNSALDAVLQLVKIANDIHLIYRGSEPKADSVMVERARENDKVHFHANARVERIYGDSVVSGIALDVEGERRELDVGGVFIEIGTIPTSEFVVGVDRNEAGEIIVNCKCETNVEGIYAAGDVTDVPAKQIIVACGEGAKAAMAVSEYLSKR